MISGGIVIYSKAALGYDPFMIFVSGLSKATGLSIGMTHVSINFSMLFLYIVLRKKQYLNIGTLLAMLITGPFIDVLTHLINVAWPSGMLFKIRIVMVLVSCPLIGSGINLFTGVRLGAGPTDLVAAMISDRTNIRFAFIRILVDGMWMLTGFLF